MIIASDKKLAIVGFPESITVKELIFLINKGLPGRSVTIIEPDKLFANPDPTYQYLNLAVKTDFILRKQVSEFLDQHNLDRFTCIHDTAFVDVNMSTIGLGVCIGPLAGIGYGTKIHNDVIVLSHSAIAHGSEIGQGTYISGHNCLGGSVTVGQWCFFGLRATVYDKVNICDDVTVSATSVVRKNITEAGIYHGSPAKKMRIIKR